MSQLRARRLRARSAPLRAEAPISRSREQPMRTLLEEEAWSAPRQALPGRRAADRLVAISIFSKKTQRGDRGAGHACRGTTAHGTPDSRMRLLRRTRVAAPPRSTTPQPRGLPAPAVLALRERFWSAFGALHRARHINCHFVGRSLSLGGQESQSGAALVIGI